MTSTKPHRLQPVMVHALLVLGSVMFAFPFAWMLMTSFKVPSEMDLDRLRLFPRAPQPQQVTPYFDPSTFTTVEAPDDVPDAVWEAARPRLAEALGLRIDAWRPHVPKGSADEVPSITDPATYHRLMTEGLFVHLQQRLSDDTRRHALTLARERAQAATQPPAAQPTDEELRAQLDPDIIESGVGAILAEADTLVNDDLLALVFEACYRRFCLAAPRVRTSDYQVHDLSTEPQWTVERGAVQSVTRHDGPALAQELRIDYAASPGGEVVMTCASALAGIDPTQLDRVFVRFRGDSTWARIGIQVVHRGVLYTTRERISVSHPEWIEQELRFPGGTGDILERRSYRMLEAVGPAPADAPPFLLRVTLTRVSFLRAWGDKLTNNYIAVFHEVPYARYMMTSLSLVILNIVLSIISCTLVGYAFARLQWPGRELCFALLLATMMLPGQVTMIPSFLIMKSLGWFNTLLPLWVPAAFGAPFFIFLFRQFFRNIPADLEDAARIDGCGFLRIYWHVMLPLVKPTIATVAIFTFMGTWNNFMGPLIMLNNEYLFPLALGLFKFNLRSGGDIGLMMAGALVMTLPILSLFFFVQRFFIQGISLAGTKA